MNPTIDILRGELERLFTLEEMTSMSERLLGLDPVDVGGTSAKGSFARALTERCVDGERIEALVDVLRVQKREVDPRIFDIAAVLGHDDFAPGRQVGELTIQKKLGESDMSTVYVALKGGEPYALKILRREAARDRRAVRSFLEQVKQCMAQRARCLGPHRHKCIELRLGARQRGFLRH